MTADTRRRIEAHIANLGDEDQNIALSAQRRLIRFGTKAVDALTKACESANPQVRYRAVWALGKIGDNCAYGTILRLTNDPAGEVSYDAFMALGVLGDERAIVPLADKVRHAAIEDVNASAAAMALSKFGEKAIPIAREIARTGSNYGKQMAQQILDSDSD